MEKRSEERRLLVETDAIHSVVYIDKIEFDEKVLIEPVKIMHEGVKKLQ